MGAAHLRHGNFPILKTARVPGIVCKPQASLSRCTKTQQNAWDEWSVQKREALRGSFEALRMLTGVVQNTDWQIRTSTNDFRDWHFTTRVALPCRGARGPHLSWLLSDGCGNIFRCSRIRSRTPLEQGSSRDCLDSTLDRSMMNVSAPVSC